MQSTCLRVILQWMSFKQSGRAPEAYNGGAYASCTAMQDGKTSSQQLDFLLHIVQSWILISSTLDWPAWREGYTSARAAKGEIGRDYTTV